MAVPRYQHLCGLSCYLMIPRCHSVQPYGFHCSTDDDDDVMIRVWRRRWWWWNDNDNGDDKEDIDNVCAPSFSATSRAWLEVFFLIWTKSGWEVTDILGRRTRWVVRKFWKPQIRCQVEVAAWDSSCRWVSGVKTSFVPGCLDNKWQRMIFMFLIGFVTFLALLLILCCGIFLLIWNTNYRLLGHFQFSRQVGTGPCKKISGRILVSCQALETRWRALVRPSCHVIITMHVEQKQTYKKPTSQFFSFNDFVSIIYGNNSNNAMDDGVKKMMMMWWQLWWTWWHYRWQLWW